MKTLKQYKTEQMKNSAFAKEYEAIQSEMDKIGGGEDMQKIVVNKIKCNKCGDEIESVHRHDFKFCKCGAVAVDGGKDYLRRVGNCEDWEELSECKGE